MMVESSPPPSPVPVLEPEHPDLFTVDQLLSLHRQLQAIAPSGYMLGRELTDTLVRLSNQTMGSGEIYQRNKVVRIVQLEMVVKILAHHTNLIMTHVYVAPKLYVHAM
jgi:hypothetical protein